MPTISLIGPGNIDFHYQELLEIKKEKFQSELENIARTLSSSKSSIELLPDKGVSFEIAKIYKQLGGEKVIGAVPQDDKTFGINHLQEYINAKVNGEKLFDKIINSGDWFKHDLIKVLFGDAVLYLGSSPGTDGELNYGTYLHNLINKMKKFKPDFDDKVHPETLAGKKINFTYLVYTPFIKEKKLPFETEEYIKKFGINLVYIHNSEELQNAIKELKSD